MSRQIQIRRGTAAENDAFTGAIGEVTMDTTNKTLRIHDGTTAGGTVLAKKSEIPEQQTLPDNYDFVIESQEPTSSNNRTWYRKYKSGWVEQGGYTNSSSSPSGYITLPVTMASTDYWATSQWRGAGATDVGASKSNYNFCEPYSTTQILVGAYDTTHPCIWQVKGMAAQ